MIKNKNNKAIWNTRIKKDTSNLFQKVGNSINVDKRLYKEDIAGSTAHVEMLFDHEWTGRSSTDLEGRMSIYTNRYNILL